MDVRRKTILITGATSGIGRVAAAELANKGLKIVFTARNEEAGKRTRDEIIIDSGNEEIHFLFCDLASLDSVRKACLEFQSKFKELHVLINNAGIWNSAKRLSKDGIEETFAVNYLAVFLMTNLLLGPLKAGSPSRIINVASGLHTGTINFEDIEFVKGYSGFRSYRQSKLAIILYTRILAQKLEQDKITVNCVQPGMAKTNLVRDAGWLSKTIFKLLAKNPEKGAEKLIYSAMSGEMDHITGKYLRNNRVSKSSGESENMELAEKLWKKTQEYFN